LILRTPGHVLLEARENHQQIQIILTMHIDEE